MAVFLGIEIKVIKVWAKVIKTVAHRVLKMKVKTLDPNPFMD
jgi:hypothetical protein